MYKVKCDDYLLYADGMDKYSIISPKLELELNKAGKFTFTIYPKHPCYGLINRLKSIITVYQDDEIIFRGRVLESEQGWHNELKMTCEGELAFLNDSIIRPYNYMTDGQITITELFTKFINDHNSQVDEEKKFTVGNVTVTDGDKTNTENLISRSSEDYATAWNAINDKLLKPLGGYLVVRHEADGNYIDYLADINREAIQSVEFGKNLLDITQTVSGDEIATAIIPLGAKDEETGKRITIAEVAEAGGKDYIINEEQAERFGLIFQTVIWDDVTIAKNLYDKATEYISSIGALIKTIEVNAVDISPINSNASSFKLGSSVRVKSSNHQLDQRFMIEKLSIDLMKPESNKLTLGSTVKTFTEQSNSTSSAIQSLGEKVATSEQNVIDLNNSIEERISAEIDISTEGIIQIMEEGYYTKGETDALVSQTKTEFEQTTDEFNFRFTQYDADIDDVVAGTDAQFEEIRQYIRFVDGNIILGEEENELTLKIQNDRISFLENDIEVAYVSNKKLYITDGTFINSMNIGNFGFFPRANGNLSLKKVGE